MLSQMLKSNPELSIWFQCQSPSFYKRTTQSEQRPKKYYSNDEEETGRAVVELFDIVSRARARTHA